VEVEAMKIVGKYVPKTETLRSWDIRGLNIWLNRVFELNRLPYAGYPGNDDTDAAARWGKKAVATVDEGPSRGTAPSAATKKRKLDTTTEGLGASECFAAELLETCAVPGERMSSPELRESSARMLKVTRGRWPRNVLIPRAAGEDMFTSRLAHEMKIFPYGWNVATVVMAVMEKDRQDTPWKRRAFARVGDPRREVKMARASAKTTTPGASMPPPVTLGPSAPLPALPMQERRRASPTYAVEAAVGDAEVSLDISVGDYTMGGVAKFDAHIVRGPVGEFSVFFVFVCFLDEVLLDRGAEAETGQLAVVPAPATASVVALGAKGPTLDPWARFCASGEIASAAAVKDLAGSAVQQLKHVSNLCLWECFLYCDVEFDSALCQVTTFAEHIASGALTSEFATKRRRLEGRIARLRTQRTKAVRDKSAAENKSCNLLEKLSAAEVEKEDLGCQLVAEKENTKRARAEAQAARDRAHAETQAARAEANLALQCAADAESGHRSLRGYLDRTETSTCTGVDRAHKLLVDAYRELGARTTPF
jgi:hypothetical protein